MERLEDQYLAFTSAGISILVPIAWVGRVSLQEEEGPPLAYLEQTIQHERANPKRRYQVLLERGQKAIRVAADEVIGIRLIDKEQFIKLEKPVINDQNRYLKAAVSLKIEGGRESLAFLADPEILWELQSTNMEKQQAATALY